MSNYVSVPKRSIWSFLALILVGAFTYFQAVGYLIPGLQKLFSLDEEMIKLTNIGLIWIPVITYSLVGMMIFLTVRIFKKMKGYEESGLIRRLIEGLIMGLLWGLIGGFITGLITGLIWGLIIGLIIGFFIVLIDGLKKEFEK